MLSKTRWVIAVAMLASALLFTAYAYPAKYASDRAGSRGSDKCDPNKGKRIQDLLDCAWDEAGRQMREKYSSCSEGLCHLDRPTIRFRKGEWYDNQLRQYVVGDTDLHDNPPIQVGLTGDIAFDYETTVHEFKHYIVDRLRLGEAAHRWIDSGDDQIGVHSTHTKKAR